MYVNDDSLLNLTSAISEDDVIEFLNKLNSNDKKVSREEVTTLLQNRNAQRYFKFNTNQYCELHKLVIEGIEDALEFTEFLKNENAFQKSIIDRDQFHASFVEILFPTLIKASGKFPQAFEETSKIIQRCFFSDKQQEFECYLTDIIEKEKCLEKHSLCKSLFKFLRSFYFHELGGLGFKLLFHSFSKAYKNFTISYKLFVILIDIVGFEVKDELNIGKIKNQIRDPLLINSLNILNDLLDVIIKLKINLECKLNDVTFSDFLRNLLKSVIALTVVPNVCCYEIFLKIFDINPLLVESVINEIIIYVMISDNSNCRMQYEEVIIKIFDIYSRLHRIQNFISKMVPTLKAGLQERTLNETVYGFRGDLGSDYQTNVSYNVNDIFPKNVLNYFTNCIINLASWQVINLLKTLLYHMNKAVDELSESEGDVYMEVLSTLTCWVLSSVRMAEHTITPSTVIKFVGCLEELRTILGNFGKVLLRREHNHVLMRAFLNICYYSAEIYMTLEYYSTNDEVQMKKNMGNDFSACNLTYLHPYLNDEEWCLISERISNFGEKPCKELMQKLLIQKLRAFSTFEENTNEEIITPVIRAFSIDFDASVLEISTDKFLVATVLEKMPRDNVISLAEVIVKDLLEGNTELIDTPHICDSRLITNASLNVVFTRMNTFLKQKRKHDEIAMKKTSFSKIIAILPPDFFLCNDENFVEKVVKIVISENNEQIDIKINDDKIQKYLEVLRKLPVIFCDEVAQKFVILLLMALHKDLKHSNCEYSVKKAPESVIISILQHSKFTLLDIFDACVLLPVLDNFNRSEELFLYTSQNVFKSDLTIVNFEPVIVYIIDNLKHDDKYLRFAVTVLNCLNKIKKMKISPASKELCVKYKSDVCQKIVKLIGKRDPEEGLIEPYALALKIFLAKDEGDALSKLRIYLRDYIIYCLCNLSEGNLKGCLLLFTAILHHKSTLSEFQDEFILRIWDAVKTVINKDHAMEEYSQLVMLISTLIPNDQFSNIFKDLLKDTEESIDDLNYRGFYKHLKTWTCILTTNFNPTKTNVLREQLEFLLQKLILLVKSVEYNEELFEEVIQFEISIIQANHVPLTAAIMDFFLLTVSILMTKKSHEFVRPFNSSIALLENLLKYRNPLIMDRLPPYLLQYRLLLKELCGCSVTLLQNQEQKIADCAHKLEKLTKSLVECTRDMSRIAMYLIADILGQYELETLYPNVKKHLNNCIYSLISLCDQHAVQYLMRVLSNASTEIFKMMYDNYKKYHRFTGKV